MPDLVKLRRFSLAIGVVLFSYVVADLKPDSTAKLLVFSFEVGRPALIPIGLVVASVWSIVRYWHYGIMVEGAPWQHRREILAEAIPVGDTIPTYSARFDDVDRADAFLKQVADLFPRFFGRRTLRQMTLNYGQRVTKYAEKLGQAAEYETTKEGATVTFAVSPEQRAAAWFRDFDFYSPVWVNAVALGAWLASIWF